MKFSKKSQLILVSSIGLVVATFLSACMITTIDYVYVATISGTGSSADGAITPYAADSQTGALRPVNTAVDSGGIRPVALASTVDYTNLYVVNAGSKNIVHFTVSIVGALTADTTTATVAGTPSALAVNSQGTFLYVVSSNPAALTVFPLSSGKIGAAAATVPLNLSAVNPSLASDVIVPTGVAVLANNTIVQGNALFVSAYDQSAYNPGGTTTSNANPGWVFSFAIGANGVLTAGTDSPYQAGVKPSAVIAEPTNHYVYVTDYAANQLIAYTVIDGSTLSFLPNGPFKTGNEPSAIAVDPRGKFLYVTNALDSTVSAYDIDLGTGTPTATVASSGVIQSSTDTQPVAVVVDPALGRFVYTANFLGNSVSGFTLNTTSGSLKYNQATPYPTGQYPTAILGVPHGNHSTATITP